jgi:uncharacterized repeat protein (TIGR01451 family)
VRWISVFAITVAILGGLAAACGDDGPPPPASEEPTTLSLTKTAVETGQGEFRFTLELTNAGENAAINVTAADVWQEGLEVTDVVHSVADQPPEDVETLPDLRVVPVAIDDFGLQFTLGELEAGETVQLEYTARCQQSGDWENTAVATAINSEPVQAVVTAACP